MPRAAEVAVPESVAVGAPAPAWWRWAGIVVSKFGDSVVLETQPELSPSIFLMVP